MFVLGAAAARSRGGRLLWCGMGPKKRGARGGEAGSRVAKAPRGQGADGTRRVSPALASLDVSPSGRYWLVKGEFETRLEKTPTGEDFDTRFNLDDLRSSPGGTTRWDGVRNFAARNALRGMKCGDRILFYHSNVAKRKGSVGPHVAGIAEVVTEAFPDPTQWDPRSPYRDLKAPPEAGDADGKVQEPRWSAVEIRYVRNLERVVSLDELKEARAGGEDALKELILLQSSRLSVQEVPPQAFAYIVHLAKK